MNVIRANFKHANVLTYEKYTYIEGTESIHKEHICNYCFLTIIILLM
jgi:hypothetical protein